MSGSKLKPETPRAEDRAELLQMTAKVVSAYVGNNDVEKKAVPDVITSVYRALVDVDGRGMPPRNTKLRAPAKAAVPIKRSITPEYLVCLEDGKKLKMLKRHLRTSYGLTPEQYRSKWGLPADYPMVAPNYAAQRSAFAKKIGLGKTTGNGRGPSN